MSGDHIAQGIDPRIADRILSSVSIQSLRRSKIVIWVAQRNYHSTLCNSHYCLLLMSIAELWIKNLRFCYLLPWTLNGTEASGIRTVWAWSLRPGYCRETSADDQRLVAVGDCRCWEGAADRALHRSYSAGHL